MKRIMFCLLILVVFGSCVFAESENIALMTKGGLVTFSGTLYTAPAENAFDGVDGNPQCAWSVKLAANQDAALDRIWYGKAIINEIELRTTGSGRAYEYRFLYWDLNERQWKEIVSVSENTDMEVNHVLETPIVTNKMRYQCFKTGPKGDSTYHGIYQIKYFGELKEVNGKPLSPANAAAERLTDTSARLSWTDPGAVDEDTRVMGFRIHRGASPDFEPDPTNCIADETVLSVNGDSTEFEFEDKKCTEEKTYYKLISISNFGGESDSICLSIPKVIYTENIGIISESDERTGYVDFKGTPYSSTTGPEKAFDGDSASRFDYDIVRKAENINIPVDRVWNNKVKIGHVYLRTTGSGRGYEYKFFYWDLKTRDWKEIVYIEKNDGSSASRYHYFEIPIVTNKMRFICYKVGAAGTSNIINIYEVEYYGEFVDNEPPLTPENAKSVRLSDTSTKISWSDPGPDSEGEPAVEFRIYKSQEQDFEAKEETRVAKDKEFTTIDGSTAFSWIDNDCSRDRYYYKILSFDEIGDASAPANIILRGLGSITGTIEQEIENERIGALEGVTVELLDEQGQRIDNTTSNSSGEYSFPDVEDGIYQLRFSKEGHFPVLIDNIPVEPKIVHQVSLVVLVADRIPPLAPIEDVNNQISIEPGVVTLFWKNPGEAEDGDEPSWYNVYRSSEEIPVDILESEIENFIVASDIEVLEWTDYEIPYSPAFYQVRSFDQAGNPSKTGLSFRVETLLAEVPQPLGTGNGLSFDRKQNITLTWPEVENAISYDLEFSMDENFSTLLDTISGVSENSTVWMDQETEGRRYWRVRANFDNGAKSLYSEPSWFDILDLGIEDGPEVRLLSVVPGFITTGGADEFQIQVGLNEDAIVTLNIYDLGGRLVKTILNNEPVPMGLHTYTWNGKNISNKELHNGLYLLQLKLNLSGQTITSVKRIGIFR